MPAMISALRRCRLAAVAFGRSRDGNIGMLFAVILLPLLTIAGLGLDWGRTTQIKNTLQAALDAAAEAAAQKIGLDQENVREVAKAAFMSNVPESLRETEFEILVDKEKRTVDMTLETKVKTPILALTGKPEAKIAVAAHARQEAPRISVPAALLAPDANKAPNFVNRDVRRAMEELAERPQQAPQQPSEEQVRQVERALQEIMRSMRSR